jgi:hypothetical protein
LQSHSDIGMLFVHQLYAFPSRLSPFGLLSANTTRWLAVRSWRAAAHAPCQMLPYRSGLR